jgi:hypothetical protein
VISLIKYLARQGLAFRGYESTEGNLYKLLMLRSEDVPELQSWLTKVTNFTSPESQNEILTLMNHEILRNICSSINKESKQFAVIMDGTQDITGSEQESICIRYTDKDLNVHEDFVGMYEAPSTTGQTLATIVEDVLIRLQLPICNLRGQTYDGAANMAGPYNGCQAVILKKQPLAL